jgi:hypothetical protein
MNREHLEGTAYQVPTRPNKIVYYKGGISEPVVLPVKRYHWNWPIILYLLGLLAGSAAMIYAHWGKP